MVKHTCFIILFQRLRYLNYLIEYLSLYCPAGNRLKFGGMGNAISHLAIRKDIIYYLWLYSHQMRKALNIFLNE